MEYCCAVRPQLRRHVTGTVSFKGASKLGPLLSLLLSKPRLHPPRLMWFAIMGDKWER